MKNKFLILSVILAFVLCIFGGYHYYNFKFVHKEISTHQMELLGGVSSKRDYCNILGFTTSEDSELYKSTISKLYFIVDGKKHYITSEHYYSYVDEGIQVYNKAPDRNNPLQVEMLKTFCSQIEQQAINLRIKFQ
ncbi:hypothetical protein BNNNBJKE_00021 [Aeromonas phage vB_AdhM_DL]|nr:hypothetical protein BNCALIDO_00075 [Aeromonas phage vB_AdhM_TS9]WBF79605.1 hypothetical protein BNNNBJKE_00021 [Aeromonas phage vB_AdhM_DL]